MIGKTSKFSLAIAVFVAIFAFITLNAVGIFPWSNSGQIIDGNNYANCQMYSEDRCVANGIKLSVNGFQSARLAAARGCYDGECFDPPTEYTHCTVKGSGYEGTGGVTIINGFTTCTVGLSGFGQSELTEFEIEDPNVKFFTQSTEPPQTQPPEDTPVNEPIDQTTFLMIIAIVLLFIGSFMIWVFWVYKKGR